MRNIRIIIGLGIWAGAAAAMGWISSKRPPKVDRTAQQLYQHAWGTRYHRAIRTNSPLRLAVGDPVFELRNGQYVQVGEVSRWTPPNDGVGSDELKTELKTGDQTDGQVLFYPSPGQSGGSPQERRGQLVHYTTPESLAWVMQTMLPDDKRQEIAHEISWAMEQHSEEIVAELRPIVERSLREAMVVVEEDLERALRHRSGSIEKVAAKYQTDLVEREIVPLVKREIWPLVMRRGMPLSEEIGKEVWQRASLWRFSWRYAYDISPLPNRRLVETEWRRFLEEEAAPVMESHIDDFIYMQQQLLAEIANNRQVQRVMRRSLEKIVRDPEVQAIVMDVVREVFVENDKLREVFNRNWRSPEAQRAFHLAAERFEPTAVRIGEMLFGTPQDGITPEFTRVLRNQILGKDRRWLIWIPADAVATPEADANSPQPAEKEPIVVKLGQPGATNPFVNLAGAEN